MMPSAPAPELSDEEVVRRVVGGETAMFEVLMRRHNQRVYRALRSLFSDEAEVEDAMQQAYLAAWKSLPGFAGTARFSTWLLRVAMNEGLARLRRRQQRSMPTADAERIAETMMSQDRREDPEARSGARELAAVLERAVQALPDPARTVYMLRDVEGLDTAECAEVLGVTPEVVKTRLHRARLALRARVERLTGHAAAELFAFHASRCDRVVAAVMARLVRAQE